MIGDDELALAVFEISKPGPAELRRALPGELPEGAEGRQGHKPDVEALTASSATASGSFTVETASGARTP